MGQGDTGQLGLGEAIMERGKPCPVGGALDGLSVVQVVCGGIHTAALTEDGKVGCAVRVCALHVSENQLFKNTKQMCMKKLLMLSLGEKLLTAKVL